MLMSFMAEDDAYEVANIVVTESLERCHYVPLGNRHMELFGIAFHRLLKEHLSGLALR